jgi:hypothetical protein
MQYLHWQQKNDEIAMITLVKQGNLNENPWATRKFQIEMILSLSRRPRWPRQVL